jgi:membrane dipeptidase
MASATFLLIPARELLGTAPCSRANPDGPVVLSEQALRIHRDAPVFDGHNDLPETIRDLVVDGFDKCDISKPQPQFHTDIPRLRQGGLGAQFWSVYVPASLEKTGGAMKQTLEQVDLVRRMVARYPETFELASTADD